MSDTRVFPTTTSGGSGLAIGGGTSTAVAQYSDYLDASGVLLATPVGGGAPNDWYYKRMWQVAQLSANVKQLTVKVMVRVSALGGTGMTPQTTVTSLKAFPF